MQSTEIVVTDDNQALWARLRLLDAERRDSPEAKAAAAAAAHTRDTWERNGSPPAGKPAVDASQWEAQMAHCDVAVRRLLCDRPVIPQHSRAWFALRRPLLTASNCGSILGMNRYCSADEMFRRKTGQLGGDGGDVTQTAATLYGTATESIARAAVVKHLGLALVADPSTGEAFDAGLVIHNGADRAFLGASPDGIFACGFLLEIKCPYSRAIKHDVPPEYWGQLQQQLEVCDLPFCVFAQFRPASVCALGTLDIQVVQRDRDWFERVLRDNLRPFWQRVCRFYAETQRVELVMPDLREVVQCMAKDPNFEPTLFHKLLE
jgi:putative phage-type endonuclease